MKIEKLNDNQIRCTLTKADLADRQIKLSELAYGSEKAKSLFRDMMLQASSEFGFEANDIPLMIEAIPMPNECVVLIITKVSDPEELDTRFSRFSPASSEGIEQLSELKKSVIPEGADEILDIFKRLAEQHLTNSQDEKKKEQPAAAAEEIDLTRLYVFNTLDHVIEAAKTLKDYYHGENRLYKNTEKQLYYLIISKSSHTPEEFNKVCNILTEYAGNEPYSRAVEAYMAEHYEAVILTDALQRLQNA
ncbi:MAG: adaptor protein MecA [Lachnospiraceae bacterium]